MKKISVLFFLLNCFAMVSLAQSPGQTLRGTITDADNGEPLAGVSVFLLKTNPPIGTSSTASGSYVIEKLPVGRYQVQASHLGYETLTITEVLVESGREAVLNIRLRERTDSLATVVVKASPTITTVDHIFACPVIVTTVEEQFRFPATNFDPARLATAYPGVAGENDGTNIISVHGNSPNALQWRLEGVEIVNPNHTANGGTFGDRPTGAAGGVNILSAQLLGSSNLFTGAFPAQYGNALGGVMDMYLRKGNDQRHELIAQAGFIGIEAAAEGPIAPSQPPPKGEEQGLGTSQVKIGSNSPSLGGGRGEASNSPSLGGGRGEASSFLANYRYSFTGLLTGMGVDFGDEETAFQDVAFHVSLPSAKAGQFTLFGVGGKSSTLYRSPTDSATIDKERYNIDFNSKMGALGMTHVLPIGKQGVLRTVAVASALEHTRTADFVESGERWEDDLLRQQKMAFSSIFSYKINASNRWKVGFEATYNDDSFYAFYKNSFVNFENGGDATGWLVQPFFDWHFSLGEKIKVVAGLHSTIFTMLRKEALLEPRLSLDYNFGRGTLSLAYGLHSQNLPTQLNAYQYTAELPSNPRAHHFATGYQLDLKNSLIFKAGAFFQYLFKQPVYLGENGTLSLVNFTDFSTIYLANGQSFEPDRFDNSGEGRNYGLDVSLQKYLTNRYFFLLAGSLYRSEYAAPEFGLQKDKWKSTRFDGGHTLNLTAGREFAKQKTGKTIISGISSRVAWLGGFRETPIDEAASATVGYTVYQQQFAFHGKLDDYFRIDLRLYRKWNKTGRNSMLSLDIQNVASRKNIQYHYFDTVQGKILEKRQLGLIPILTWRGEF